jgi:hypothetical protein
MTPTKARQKTHQPRRARRPKGAHAPRRAPRRRKPAGRATPAVRATIARIASWRARAVSALRRHPARAAIGAVALAAALSAGIARRA